MLNGNFTDSCSTLRAHIWQTKSWQIYPPQMAISQIPALTAHISFLLWKLIVGRPSVGRSTPLLNGNFTYSCSDSSELNIWQTRSWQIYPPINGNFTYYCSDSSELNIWQTKSWQIYPPQISQIPALTAHISFLLWELNIWQTRSWQICPPCQMVISQIPALLWKLIFGRPSVGISTPHKQQFLIPALTAHISFPLNSYLTDQVLADLPPPKW